MRISPINPQRYNYNIFNIFRASNSNSFSSGSSSDNKLKINASTSDFSFMGEVRTRFVSRDEKARYSDILSIVDKDSRKKLSSMLKSGLLLNSDSNDNSTVLDNLYKIATTPRAKGLDRKSLLEATINIVENPYTITQLFGDIPDRYQEQAINLFFESHKELEPSNLVHQKIAKDNVNINHSGTCVAASIEFNLARQNPAEFARFVEGLSSHKMSVSKTISLKNLADNTLDAFWLLNAFEIPYEAKDFERAKLTFRPDKNAIFRAHIQTIDKDPLERSMVDVLMQSTFMQTGSQQAYDTLIDKRRGKFNLSDKGLIEFEKTFTESVVEDKNKISVTYQTVDDDGHLVGYETGFDKMKEQILDSLKIGEPVIVGYTQVNENMKIVNGHEITIIGFRFDDNGKVMFICNDTDDNNTGPLEYNEDFLLPKIHHAALPKSIAEKDLQIVENWVEGFKTYKKIKLQNNLS